MITIWIKSEEDGEWYQAMVPTPVFEDLCELPGFEWAMKKPDKQ